MPQPTPYDRITNFQNDQALAPTDPYPAPELDQELNAVKITTDEILQNLALIQRDDGQLANDSVGNDQLRGEVYLGFDAPSAWETAHNYIEGNTVFADNAFWFCNQAHMSGVFATDLAAGYWSLIADFHTGIAPGDYASRALVATTSVPDMQTHIRTAGYYAAGDGGGALYKKVGSQPSHAGKVQSLDGAWWEIAADRMTPEMFGAKGDGVTDDHSAIAVAIGAVRAQSYNSAGVLYLGSRRYKCGATLTLPSDITLQGNGQEGSILDFSGAVGNGLAATGAYCIKLRDLQVIDATAHGISLISCAFMDLRNVFVESSGQCGLYVEDTWMATFEDVRCHINGVGGIVIVGFSTSLNFQECYADTTTVGDGWYIHDCTYSTFNACGSDLSADYGYHFRNCNGVVVNGCGSEGNPKGNILVDASAALAVGATVPDIKGLVFNGCWSGANGGGAGFYSSFAEIVSSDSRRVDVTLNGCADQDSVNGISLIVVGTGVVVNKVGGTFVGTTNVSSGAVFNDPFAAWTAYTPAITFVGGSGTFGAASGRYLRLGKTLHIEGQVGVTTNTGIIRVTLALPASLVGAYVAHPISANRVSAGNVTPLGACTCYDSGDTISISMTGVVNGDVLYFGGSIAVV